ncbi:MAG: patatin-like phospholipase family protein, partial [Myxococcales bacterium]|nr:patatin-like phospholipase family protein [Myxococcales bacterium]
MAASSIGLVLSGGGARGAYEIGVLSYVAEHLPSVLDRVRVVTGTSVGAVNGAFLASRGVTRESVWELCDIWRSLEVDALVALDHVGMRELITAGGKRLINRQVKSPPVGLLRVDGIIKLVAERADWRGLRKVVRSGRLDAVGFAATDIATGGTRFFVDYNDRIAPRWPRGEDAPF